MGTNQIPRAALAANNVGIASLFSENVGFGLDFLVFIDPRKAGSMVGKGTLSWAGAAGTWFWIDPAK